MNEEHTTAVVRCYLDERAGGSPAEPIIQARLDRAVRRLHLLCATLLHRGYPRLTRPPLNLQMDAVVERLLKTMRGARARTVREFLGVSRQDIRRGLNDLARRLDGQRSTTELSEDRVVAAESSRSALGPGGRTLEAIVDLPEDEREVLDLVRIQGMTQAEAAQSLGGSAVAVKRRLNRGLRLLSAQLTDLRPGAKPPGLILAQSART